MDDKINRINRLLKKFRETGTVDRRHRAAADHEVPTWMKTVTRWTIWFWVKTTSPEVTAQTCNFSRYCYALFARKLFGAYCSPNRSAECASGERRRQENRWGGVWEGCPLLSRLGLWRSVLSWAVQSPGRKRVLACLEGNKTLVCAPICRYFEFVKQWFHVTFGGKAKVWGQLSPAPM